MNLQIINFVNTNKTIYKKYLCKFHQGDNIMPSIKWNKINKAESYVIIFEDNSAKTPNNKCNFIHLYIKYIDKSINSIDEISFNNKIENKNTKKNKLNTKNIIFGKNHTGSYGYFGPCNPHNYIHNYSFHIYALNTIIIENNDNICCSLDFEKIYKENIINKDTKTFSYIQKLNIKN